MADEFRDRLAEAMHEAGCPSPRRVCRVHFDDADALIARDPIAPLIAAARAAQALAELRAEVVCMSSTGTSGAQMRRSVVSAIDAQLDRIAACEVESVEGRNWWCYTHGREERECRAALAALPGEPSRG